MSEQEPLLPTHVALLESSSSRSSLQLDLSVSVNKAAPTKPVPKLEDDTYGLLASVAIFVVTCIFSARHCDLSTFKYDIFIGCACVLVFVVSSHAVLLKPQQISQYCTVLLLAIVSRALGGIPALGSRGLGAAFWALVVGAVFAATLERPNLVSNTV
jgi:hypothetical protein